MRVVIVVAVWLFIYAIGIFSGYLIRDKILMDESVRTSVATNIEVTTTKPYTSVVRDIEEDIVDDQYEPVEYSEDDILLAKLLYSKAKDYPDDFQIALASVIMNRVESKTFPDTVSDVIYDDTSFSLLDKQLDIEPDERCVKHAHYVIEHGSQIPRNVLYVGSRNLGELWRTMNGYCFFSMGE